MIDVLYTQSADSVSSACNRFISKTLLRGAENLRFYEPHASQNKKVMTLPLLEIIGHEIANENWCDKSKSVVWTALLVGFWGSFRFGELLSKDEKIFHEKETLLWSDIKFVECDSVIIHNKIPKNRTPVPLISLCSTCQREKVQAVVNPRLIPPMNKHINTLCGISTISKPC